MSMFLTGEQVREVRSVVDSGEWKYTWHLPQTGYGVDWMKDETLQKCLEVSRNYEEHHLQMFLKCKKAREALELVLKCRAENYKETSGNG